MQTSPPTAAPPLPAALAAAGAAPAVGSFADVLALLRPAAAQGGPQPPIVAAPKATLGTASLTPAAAPVSAAPVSAAPSLGGPSLGGPSLGGPSLSGPGLGALRLWARSFYANGAGRIQRH